MDPNSLQKRMNEIQSDASFANALGKLISGRPGYKPVIESKQVIVRCKKCNKIMDDSQKFCDECGTKVERPEK
jgi:rRNA maturation endonuclease Nob1